MPFLAVEEKLGKNLINDSIGKRIHDIEEVQLQVNNDHIIDQENTRGLITMNMKELSLDEKVKFYNWNENFI